MNIDMCSLCKKQNILYFIGYSQICLITESGIRKGNVYIFENQDYNHFVYLPWQFIHIIWFF